MENATNCVALFYKVDFSMKDFSRKQKFTILPSRYSAKNFSKLYLYLSFKVTIKSTINYVTDDFEISKKISPSGVIFQYF